MVDPHGCIDQNHSGSAATGRRFGFSLRAAKGSQTSGAHLGDESLETQVNKGCFFFDPRKGGGLGEDLLIQNQCRSHAYVYGFSVCTGQATAAGGVAAQGKEASRARDFLPDRSDFLKPRSSHGDTRSQQGNADGLASLEELKGVLVRFAQPTC